MSGPLPLGGGAVSADLSVRPAIAGDEEAITAIQLAAWGQSHAERLGPRVLAQLDAAAMTASWRVAITAPPGPGYRVLVACAGPRVVGLASVVPVPAQDAELGAGGLVLAFEVAPGDQRAGHGSRLLAAVVDLVRLDGGGHVQTWVLTDDEARIRFFSQAGLGPDGAMRSLTTATGPEGLQVREARWVALI
ncbi:MAG: GNAT family N-acetyltransferase [Cellulomonas sp.]|nr:GNAT family N-acetyltransferase [Cellulomonas sp.]